MSAFAARPAAAARAPARRARFAAALAASLAAAALSISCAAKLDGAGTVRFAAQAEDPALERAAASIDGSALVQDIAGESWSARLGREEPGPLAPDLYAADWGNELLAAAAAGRLASLEKLWPRSKLSRSLPRFARSIVPGPAEGFVPVSVGAWGLFYNRELAADLGAVVRDQNSQVVRDQNSQVVRDQNSQVARDQNSQVARDPHLPLAKDLDELASLFARAKARGLVPVALGAAYGWPASAWLSYLDLRLNGGEAARERALGLRPFDDPSGVAAAERLAAWRDSGYFSPDAAGTGVVDSLAAVESGRALVVLMGAFGEDRFADASGVGFMAVPPARSPKGRPGEIASVGGFAFASAGADPEAALALVEAYVLSGSLGPARPAGTLPVMLAQGAARGAAPNADGSLAAVAARALAQADWIVPQLDRIAPPRFGQDALRLWKAFFAPGSAMTGGDLAEALQAAWAASAKGAKE